MTNTKVSKIVDSSIESSDALNYAMAMTKKENSEIFAITFFQLPSFFEWATTETLKEWKEEYKQKSEKFLDQIYFTTKENNVKIRTEIVESPISAVESIV